jgi:hypothetical protein
MFSLTQIKQNIENNKRDNYNQTLIGNSLPVLTKIIKKQNLVFLKRIAKFKNLSNLETTILIEKYHKLNYYCPTIKK